MGNRTGIEQEQTEETKVGADGANAGAPPPNRVE